jgi:hypothetical protein
MLTQVKPALGLSHADLMISRADSAFSIAMEKAESAAADVCFAPLKVKIPPF